MRKTVATKKQIIAGLIEKSCDIKAACKFARVKSTKSYYDWLGNDPDFKTATETILNRFRKSDQPEFQPEKRRTKAQKKENFLSGYEFMGGNIRKAATYGRVSDKSYYNWMEEDPAFAQKIKKINERRHEEYLDSIRWSTNALRRMEAFRVVSILWEMRKKDSGRYLDHLNKLP